MNRLVVIAIGGSGERVMASFIMELAAGMQVDATSVLPIFIDNDSNSHSLTECKNLINYYRQQGSAGNRLIGANSIYEKALGTDSSKWPSFFKTIIEEPIYLDSDGANIGDLSEVIGNLDESKQNILEERDLLFTEKDLKMPLDGGFIGNPNIGSVVLNAIALHDERYESKHEEICNGDGVVVIGSLFGGTGAAGIPLIVNKFREKGNQAPYIGVVSLLPYFTTSNTSKVDNSQEYDVISDMFDVKTRAALMYYDDYMQDVDVQYYVGDRTCKAVYPHHIMGDDQNNSAHPIEVMAALSIIDFSKGLFEEKVIYKRPTWSFSDEADSDDALSSNLSDAPNEEFRIAVAKFQMMKWLFTEGELLKDDISEDRPFVKNLGFTEEMRIATCTNESNKIKQFPQAWGLNMLFRSWDSWSSQLTNPQNSVPSKRKASFFRMGDVTEDNLTQMFYTNHENGWGIANVKMVGRWRGKHPEPVTSDVKDALIDAYDELVKQKVLPDSNSVPDEHKKLPYLLLIISKALDSILKEKCSI